MCAHSVALCHHSAKSPSAKDGVEMGALLWMTNETLVTDPGGVRTIRTPNDHPGCDSCYARAARASHLLARMARRHLAGFQLQVRSPRQAVSPARHPPARLVARRHRR